MQRHTGAQADVGAQTSIPRCQCPSNLTQDLLDYSMDASVLQVKEDNIRFTHQLLQEYLASRLLLEASCSDNKAADEFWPASNWWERTGWEVVAEIAAESCGNNTDAQIQLIAWLAKANPEVACDVWRHLGKPDLLPDVLTVISNQWFVRMTDIEQEPHPHARAAIGRALGNFGLDRRKGVGLRSDNLPDIDWVKIPSTAFIYQDSEYPPLPTFYLARFLITNAQFQSFIDAGGYQEDVWWQGLTRRIETPRSPTWDEPNAPRENVSWFEAIAFCRWLSIQLGLDIHLPTEQQWERAARGVTGLAYPWGRDYQTGFANCNETRDKKEIYYLARRTSAVGLYTQASSPESLHDMAGNLWEWCLNEHNTPKNCQLSGDVARVLRGGSWRDVADYVRSSARLFSYPGSRNDGFGFRVLCSSPIE